jgi:colanic acid biosynthesis glycosyl transferase WcaI
VRVLLPVVQFPPDVNSTGLLMAELGQGLVGRGHEVSVVTTFPHYEQFRVWDEYRGKLLERSRYGDLDVLRLWVYASGKKSRMFDRLLSYLSFNTLATLSGLMADRRYDAILCPNGSFFTGMTASIIGKRFGVPYVYNVQDLYPETFVHAGQLKNRMAIRGLEHIERFMYACAAAVTVVAPSFARSIIRKGVPISKVKCIPNFVNTSFIAPLPKVNSFSKQYGLADKFVVAHAGNLGYVYDLDALLDAAVELADEPDIRIVIVGDGVQRQRLVERARRQQLDNVVFLPFQPQAVLPLLRAACDVHVSLYRSGSALYSMPSKVYEIMASGRPSIVSAEADSDVRALIETTGCGIGLDPHDGRALAAAICQLYRDPARRRAMGTRGRREAVRSYSTEVVVDQYDTLLRRLAYRPATTDPEVSHPTLGRLEEHCA